MLVASKWWNFLPQLLLSAIAMREAFENSKCLRFKIAFSFFFQQRYLEGFSRHFVYSRYFVIFGIFFFFFSEFLERYFQRFYEIRYLWKGLEGHKMTQGSPREGFIIIILFCFFNFPAPTLHVGVKATCLVRHVTLVRLLGRLSTDIWTEKLFECKEFNCRSLFPQFSSIISNISFESLNPLFLPLWVMCPQQTFKL